MKKDKKKNQILFFVSDSEKEIIHKKMNLIRMTNTSEYLRRMAIYGYIVDIDMDPLNNISMELNYIGKNVNQLAKRANETGNIYYDDIVKLRKDLIEIKESINLFTKFLNDEIDKK